MGDSTAAAGHETGRAGDMAIPRVMPRALVGAAASAGEGLVYVNAPKCGCSSIKRTLLQIEMDRGRLPRLALERITPEQITPELVHLANPMDPQRIDDLRFLADARAFTVVRNPYTRVLSAYLDKIRDYDENVTPGFEARHGVRAADLDLAGFLERIRRERPEDMEPHWAPLSSLLGLGLIAYGHVGKLEAMDEFFRDVLGRFSDSLPGVLRLDDHRRDASARLRQSYDARTLALVEEIYARDFESFGYRPGQLDDLRGGPVDLAAVNRPAGSLFLGAEDPRPCRLFFQARLRLIQGRTREALEDLRQATALDPGFTYAHYQEAHILAREGQDARALAAVERAIELKHDDPNFHRLRSVLLERAQAAD